MFSKAPDVICQCLYQLGCVTKLTVQGLHPFQSLISHDQSPGVGFGVVIVCFILVVFHPGLLTISPLMPRASFLQGHQSQQMRSHLETSPYLYCCFHCVSSNTATWRAWPSICELGVYITQFLEWRKIQGCPFSPWMSHIWVYRTWIMAGSASWKEPGVRAPWVESWDSHQGLRLGTSPPLTSQLLLLKADAIGCTPPHRVDGETCIMTLVGP